MHMNDMIRYVDGRINIGWMRGRMTPRVVSDKRMSRRLRKLLKENCPMSYIIWHDVG